MGSNPTLSAIFQMLNPSQSPDRGFFVSRGVGTADSPSKTGRLTLFPLLATRAKGKGAIFNITSTAGRIYTAPDA